MRGALLPLALLAAALAAAAPAAADVVQLKFYTVRLDLDAGGDIWNVSTKFCNADSADSGTLSFNLWLSNAANQVIFVGGMEVPALKSGACANGIYPIQVRLGNVKPGEHRIILTANEWDGQRFQRAFTYWFDDTYSRN